jgi:hypothetical protein
MRLATVALLTPGGKRGVQKPGYGMLSPDRPMTNLSTEGAVANQPAVKSTLPSPFLSSTGATI